MRLRRSLSRSTLHARMTAAASWSSSSASSRCSSVAYSWWRSLASANARWRDCSRLRENVGMSCSALVITFHIGRRSRVSTPARSGRPDLPSFFLAQIGQARLTSGGNGRSRSKPEVLGLQHDVRLPPNCSSRTGPLPALSFVNA